MIVPGLSAFVFIARGFNIRLWGLSLLRFCFGYSTRNAVVLVQVINNMTKVAESGVDAGYCFE
jgi:hypothetical protein